MFESKYSKVLTIILVIVIVAIVALLGFLAFDYIKNYNSTKQASDFVEDYQGNITTSDENGDDSTEGNVTLDTSNEATLSDSSTSGSSSGKKKYNGYDVLGTMKIPSLNIEYPILEQNSAGALNTALILLYPKDNLNKPGNSVIQGHNYRNGMFFSNLKKITNGAKIYVTDYTGKSLTYEVYNKFEASSTDSSFYTRDTNGLAELTLSTCTDASNDVRTIVFAKQI